MERRTILLIEANREVSDAIRLMLEAEGFKVIAAPDALTALNHLSVELPDLILTDIMMPEMSGLEFIHEVRGVTSYDPIPIIAISAYDKTYLAAAIGAGADTALHKPEDIDILVVTVKGVLPGGAFDDACGSGGLIRP